MNSGVDHGRTDAGPNDRVRSPRRIVLWGTAGLLLVPLIAMQFTDQVAWDAVDFAVFGVMLVAAFGTYEIAARVTGNSFYRAAAGIAIATVFFLLWLQLAVGLVQD